MMSISRLTIDDLPAPLGVDEPPSISWAIESDEPGAFQITYQLEVLLDGCVAWESGVVRSRECIGIRPDLELLPRREYECVLKVVDNHGEHATATGRFETSKLDEPWQAEWICGRAELDDDGEVPPYHFLKEFPLKDRVVRARMYASALGCYTVQLNGAYVSDEYFAPGYTQYTDRVLYNSYDVTDLFAGSSSAFLDVEVSGGWYAGRLGLALKRNRFGSKRAFIMELHLWYEDGSHEVLGTDASWECTTDGPRRFADFFDGEVYDANREDGAGWAREPVEVLGSDAPALVAHMGLPVTRHERLVPEEVESAEEGVQLFRFSRNIAGVVALRDVVAERGEQITIRHGELAFDGVLCTDNLRTAKAELVYTCRDGLQSYLPRFTYMGFQYIAVSGKHLEASQIEAWELYSDMQETVSFYCSNSLLNQLQRNIMTSQKANFVDIPTDCPQRDERCGWTGDIALFAPTASFQMDISRFMRKWCGDVVLCQRDNGIVPVIVPDGGFESPAKDGFYGIVHKVSDSVWGDAVTLVPWAVYRSCGDSRILAETYEGMKAWVGYERRQAAKPFKHGWRRYIWSWGPHFGDWLAPGKSITENMKLGTWIATAYFANSARIVSESARVLGFFDDAREYEELFESICGAFRKKFIGPDHSITDGFQTVYALAICFDLLDDVEREAVGRSLDEDVRAHDYHLTTGFPGTPYLLEALSSTGHLDTAYRLLLQESCPSWLYPVTCGATSIWERWDALEPDGTLNELQVGSDNMVSFNHYAYGAVGLWMYEHIGGIRALEPGYRTIRIEPEPGGGIDCAWCSHVTPYGEVRVEWELEHGEGGRTLHLRALVPANTTAQIWAKGEQVETVGSGEYELAIPWD